MAAIQNDPVQIRKSARNEGKALSRIRPPMYERATVQKQQNTRAGGWSRPGWIAGP